MEGNFDIFPWVMLAVLLWSFLIGFILISLRRAKVARDKHHRADQRARRRESYIQAALEDEEAYTQRIAEEARKSRVYQRKAH